MHSLIAVDVLLEGLARCADIVHQPMPDDVAQLDIVGGRATLRLDTDSAPAELCAAMTDALLVLAFGAGAATHAEPVRRLRSVG